MSVFRLCRTSPHRIRILTVRQFSTIPPSRQQLSIPYTDTCPNPTCTCASTPPNLNIDRRARLLNTVAAYSEQVIICTGEEDWTSRIENDSGPTGDFVRGVKRVIGKGGAGFDPFNNVLLTASSLPKSNVDSTTTALLFPQFKEIKNIPHSAEAFNSFATAYVKAKTLHSFHDGLSLERKAALLREETRAKDLPPAKPITTPTVLICGHGNRDSRCGVLGPILQAEFRKEFQRRKMDARVAQISHIGGHKYAGNVIIYIPPTFQENALQGSGIWYGRVGPEHVEGVVEETLVRGRVVVDLLRGGVTQGGGDVGRMIEAQLEKDGKELGGETGVKGSWFLPWTKFQ